MVEHVIQRRTVLAAALAAPAWPALARRAPETRVTLLGQSLIQQTVQDWPGRAALVARLRRADAVFSDLETAIAFPGATATRQGEVLHAAPPGVIDTLRALGISIVTTANNHAWDLGSAGIVATLAELDARGVAHAGSGRTLAEATVAGRRDTVSLVAAAAGAIREGAAATSDRPGVNELRRDKTGALDAGDVSRTLDAIRAARRGGGVVIACLHNHYWEPDPAATPEWQRSFARGCVDAGASIFVAHGPPLLQGVERYKGVPLLHGLGSFIFQTRKGSYGPEAWQSLLVEARFRHGAFVGADVVPLQLDPVRPSPDAEFASGFPALATATAKDIARGVARLSERLGTSLHITEGGRFSIG